MGLSKTVSIAACSSCLRPQLSALILGRRRSAPSGFHLQILFEKRHDAPAYLCNYMDVYGTSISNYRPGNYSNSNSASVLALFLGKCQFNCNSCFELQWESLYVLPLSIGPWNRNGASGNYC